MDPITVTDFNENFALPGKTHDSEPFVSLKYVNLIKNH
jgi:hypothetical protein